MIKIFGKGKILGREPTLWIAVTTAFVNFLVGFNLDYLSSVQAAWICTVINAIGAILVAMSTRPIAPNVYTYALSAVAGLLGAYGLDLSQGMVTSTQSFVLVLFALVSRSQVSPVGDEDKTGVMGDKVTTEGLVRTGQVAAEVTEGIEDVRPQIVGQRLSSTAVVPPVQSESPLPPPPSGGKPKSGLRP